MFNRGRHRACFIHPSDPGKCIKVPARPGAFSQSLVEDDYYRYLARRRVPLDHLAACHGWVDTDRGRGLVFDRIGYEPGASAASVNLERAIATRLIRESEIRAALLELRRYLQRHRILWSDENPKNICVTTHPSLRFVIVDGLGGRQALNLKYRVLKSVPILARLYTSLKVTRMFQRVDTLLERASTA